MRKNIYSYPPIGSPDGGATVTAMDLVRFIRALHSHALMSETATNQLLSPQVHHEDIEPGSLWNGFGMEFRLDHAGTVVEYGKDGINAGVASTICHIPRIDTTVVLLANQDCDVWTLQDAITGVIPG